MIDVTKYEPVIDKVLARSKGGPDQKNDLKQDCYVALLERLDELGGEDDLARAEAICKKVRHDERRARTQKDVKKENRIKFVSADNPNIARQLAKIAIPDHGEISELELHEAIATLEPPIQAVIRAYFVEGLSVPKAAGKLGVTEEAIRWRKKKGIEALKKYFEVEAWD